MGYVTFMNILMLKYLAMSECIKASHEACLNRFWPKGRSVQGLVAGIRRPTSTGFGHTN